MKPLVIAAAWAVGEATFFPLVPDVWLTRVAAQGQTRTAVKATVAALAGALVGGTCTRAWAARTDPQRSRELMAKVPGVSRTMVDDTAARVEKRGNVVLLTGPLRGVPYRLFARASAVTGTSLASFLGWSVPGRWPRFALSVAVASVGHRLAGRWSLWVHAGFWTVFYAWFFSVVGRD